MNDGLALMWLNDLLGKLERSPTATHPEEYHRITAVRHAIKVIRWRERLLQKMDVKMEAADG